MTSGNPAIYKLTVRPHRKEDRHFEYVLSHPGSIAVLSEVAYPTYESAKKAGDEQAHELGLKASFSTADR